MFIIDKTGVLVFQYNFHFKVCLGVRFVCLINAYKKAKHVQNNFKATEWYFVIILTSIA